MQRPWQNSSLEGDFYFVPPPVVAAAPSTQTLVTLEGVFWDTIKASRNPADFNAYVKRFSERHIRRIGAKPVGNAATGGRPETRVRKLTARAAAISGTPVGTVATSAKPLSARHFFL